MAEESNEPVSQETRRKALHTYLRDHTAGAVHATELLKALKNQPHENPLRAFASGMLEQVEADLRVLEDLSTRMHAGGFDLKEAAGWLADKLSRVKLGDGEDAFSAFETLEFLTLGILGKRALWQALLPVAGSHMELQELDLPLLIVRAESQYAATEELRIQLARQLFGNG